MRKRNLFAIGFGFFFVATSTGVAALQPQFATDLLNSFNGVIDADVHNFITDTTGAMYQFAWAEWAFFTVILIAMTTFKWIFGKADESDVIATVFMIMGVATVLVNYDYLTQVMWSFSDLGVAYQQAVLGHGDDIMWPSKVLNKMIDNISVADVNLFVDSFKVIFWTAVYLLTAAIISIAFYLSSAWSVLGYALAKIIGFIIVPLVMGAWTRGLFDGWLKLFIGFMMYNIVSRVIMVMLVRFLESTLDSTNPITLDSTGGLDGYISYVAFMVVGIFFLVSGAGFAAILAGGFTSMQSAGSATMSTIRMATKGILGGKK